MKKKNALKNVAASVRDRLLKVMTETGQDYNVLLTRYAIERLLFRLAASKYRTRFILKGAMLFAAWQHVPHRVTKDVDLLGFGDSSPEALTAVFAEICVEPVNDDGVVFDPASVRAEPIRAEEVYAGVRVTFQGVLGSARLHVQVDVGYGDGFAVEPVMLPIPSLVGMPPPEVRTYRMETSIAEKFEAAVTLGLLNTRMKDYFDLWHLAKGFAFDGQAVSESIRATFERRAKALPESVPAGFSEEFWSDPRRQGMWDAFCKKSVRTKPHPSLEEVVRFVAAFIIPPALGASKAASFARQWQAGGPWS
ncbi:nucleotidyl transferase AbiEii/AbiGii toxin family protein [Prosthecobacter sp. SYSU 5D2]|uniref:nucleotidyl transferase AbiEii/AbiGii toxin family protein n=1 Tax=Prosthecobacter sp. SYSU 5D2 TaxID=3134134 RepID=UPI0031FF0F27